MHKDFWSWHSVKARIDSRERRVLFQEREIWWCSVGANVGSEEDGKGDQFSRPVLIVKRFNSRTFWGAPLTTSIKEGAYYYLFLFGDRDVSLKLSQLRLFDAKRLLRRMGKIGRGKFHEIKIRIKNCLV